MSLSFSSKVKLPVLLKGPLAILLNMSAVIFYGTLTVAKFIQVDDV